MAGLGAVGFAVSSVGVSKAVASEGLLEPKLILKTPGDGRATVALTLDACPGGFDAKLVQALIDWRVPATFFVTGAWIRSNPLGLATLVAHPDLFAIGNHGAHHVPAVLGDRHIFGLRVAGDLEAVREEVGRGEDAIIAATGAKPLWYRGATALYSPAVLPEIERMGFAIAGFSLNGDMGASLPAESVAQRIALAKDGDVIIAHANQPNRPSGAGVIKGVRALLDRDVRFAKLDAVTAAVASL
jgi:peptidoglycan/xylan/chitin deacetylase (PgdA/CDA1 family)